MKGSRLKNFLLFCIFIGIFGFLILGAVNITRGRSSQIKHADKAREKARAWHSQISTEVPLAQKQSWHNLGNEYPLQLLTICPIEQKEEDSETVPKN